MVTDSITRQASALSQDSALARTNSSGGRVVRSASGGPAVLVSGPPTAGAITGVPHPATPAQASRSAASEAQALAQEAAQLKAQAQNFKASTPSLSQGRRVQNELPRWGNRGF